MLTPSAQHRNLDPGAHFERLTEVSQLIEDLSGFENLAIKPVTGDRTFVRESGAVVSQLYRGMYEQVEPYPPELVGQERDVVLGTGSGKAGIHWKLEGIEYDPSEEDIEALLARVKALSSEKHHELTDEEFDDLARKILGPA